MIEFDIPPFLIYYFGAALVPLLGRGKVRKIFLVALAVFGLVSVALIQPHTSWVIPTFPGVKQTLLHADRLSMIMGYIFALAGGGAIIYGLSTIKEAGQYVCGLLYMGSALGAVFAGDFFTLFIFLEIMSFSSLGLIWYERTRRSIDAGMRYILYHIFGGCLTLAGIIIHYSVSGGSIAVGPIEPGIGYFLLLAGIGVNAGFIPLHTWIPDAYPKATIGGTIFLSIFTTKTGIYMLARTFSGVEAVAYMGGVMALYGVIFAILQNDVRKLLSYHIVSQLGYMVAGVGMAGVGMGVMGLGLHTAAATATATGTLVEKLALDGAIAHLFNNLLFKTTLFMCMGAIIYRTGKNNLTDMGGLARKMPITMITCVIAALSISGVVGFNGYISKGMIIHAAELKGMHIVALALMLASVGTLISFIKLTYFAFFAKNEHIEAKEAPLPMLVPMCITAFLCMAIGLYPKLLYTILPFRDAAFHYEAFAPGHTLGTMELVLMTLFLFFMLGYFAPHEKITLDFDHLYRKAGRRVIWFCEQPLMGFASAIDTKLKRIADSLVWFSRNPVGASLIQLTSTGMRLTKHLPLNLNHYHHPERVEQRAIEEPAERLTIGVGIAVLVVLLFFALYLIVMLIS